MCKKTHQRLMNMCLMNSMNNLLIHEANTFQVHKCLRNSLLMYQQDMVNQPFQQGCRKTQQEDQRMKQEV